MKSLEIINNNIQKHEYYDYDTNEKMMWYEVSLKEEELNKLKQDLEVLKILKNKSVDIPKLKLVAYVFPTIEGKEILERYNNDFAPNGTKNKLTFKQYQKIREWLEEQE